MDTAQWNQAVLRAQGLRAAWKALKKKHAPAAEIAAARAAYVAAKKPLKQAAADLRAETPAEEPAVQQSSAAAASQEPGQPEGKVVPTAKPSPTSLSVFLRYKRGKALRITVDEVVDFFRDCGRPVRVSNKHGGEPEGGKIYEVAIVRFREEKAVDKALSLSGSELDGREVTVGLHTRRAPKRKRAVGSCRVFVGNVPFAADDGAVREMFSRCGEILFVRFVSKSGGGKIAAGSDDKSAGYCFVIFADPRGDGGPARRAIAMDGARWPKRLFHARRVTVKAAEKKPAPEKNSWGELEQ